MNTSSTTTCEYFLRVAGGFSAGHPWHNGSLEAVELRTATLGEETGIKKKLM